MSVSYAEWYQQLRKVMVEGFFIAPEVAATLSPALRVEWYYYFMAGYGPLAALEEDFQMEAL